MNRKFPLSTLQAPSGLHVIVTAQGNHFAQTHDPAAAALIQSAPDLLGACRLALGVFRSQFPLEHGNAEICAAWGALESVMERGAA